MKPTFKIWQPVEGDLILVQFHTQDEQHQVMLAKTPKAIEQLWDAHMKRHNDVERPSLTSVEYVRVGEAIPESHFTAASEWVYQDKLADFIRWLKIEIVYSREFGEFDPAFVSWCPKLTKREIKDHTHRYWDCKSCDDEHGLIFSENIDWDAMFEAYEPVRRAEEKYARTEPHWTPRVSPNASLEGLMMLLTDRGHHCRGTQTLPVPLGPETFAELACYSTMFFFRPAEDPNGWAGETRAIIEEKLEAQRLADEADEKARDQKRKQRDKEDRDRNKNRHKWLQENILFIKKV